MKPKKIYTIVYIIIGILVAIFCATWYLSTKNPNLNFITYISGISSFFVALLTALNLYTTTNQIEVANKQLEEMKHERAMSEQPLIMIENLRFRIVRPKFYYTPPEDKYSFQSVYECSAQVKNCSNYCAISADATAKLIVPRNSQRYRLSSVTKRYGIIAPSENQVLDVRFVGDEITWLFDSLREPKTGDLPKINIVITYKNLCGGFFKMRSSAIIVPEDTDLESLRDWHSRINAAHIEQKETIVALRKLQDSTEWHNLFKQVEKEFSDSLSGGEEIELKCIHIPESFSVKAISEKQYNEEASNHHYSHYVHKAAECEQKPQPRTSNKYVP